MYKCHIHKTFVHFHYLVEEGFIFLCLTEGEMDRRIAFAFLFETKDRFFSRFKPKEIPLGAFSINNEFSKVLANQMDYYSHNPAADKIKFAKEQLSRTKQQVNENIDKLLSREEKVELLVGKTATLVDQSKMFQSQSKNLQWKIFLQNIKQFGFLLILGLIILWLTLSLFCGLSLRNC